MANKGRSDPNMFGGYTHYDSKGHKTGSSSPNAFGGYTNYDAKGHKVGTSQPGVFGGFTNYDANGRKIGTSDPGVFGGFTHRDASGKKIGSSDPGAFGGFSHHSAEQGCYIATCVYGSYDCPEVWTLRRFRDHTLARTLPGRLFIRAYYAVSPGLVRRFGACRWFRDLWRSPLDKLVTWLQEKGVESGLYQDRKR